MINENTLAKEVASIEGLKEEMNIGQIKEVIRCVLECLAGYSASEVMALVEKHEEE